MKYYHYGFYAQMVSVNWLDYKLLIGIITNCQFTFSQIVNLLIYKLLIGIITE